MITDVRLSGGEIQQIFGIVLGGEFRDRNRKSHMHLNGGRFNGLSAIMFVFYKTVKVWYPNEKQNLIWNDVLWSLMHFKFKEINALKIWPNQKQIRYHGQCIINKYLSRVCYIVGAILSTCVIDCKQNRQRLFFIMERQALNYRQNE